MIAFAQVVLMAVALFFAGIAGAAYEDKQGGAAWVAVLISLVCAISSILLGRAV